MGIIIGINASPRKDQNSAKVLNAALEGAATVGMDTRLVHLTEMSFSGCKSCFACKRLGGSSFGRCALQDDLQPLLSEIIDNKRVEGILLAMPIYFGDVPGMARNFMERLWFPGLLYDADGRISYSKSVKVGLIYTMNAPDESCYERMIQSHRGIFDWILKADGCTALCVTDTLQFDDYSKYSSSIFDPEEKTRNHNVNFPKALERAREFGMKLCLKPTSSI